MRHTPYNLVATAFWALVIHRLCPWAKSKTIWLLGDITLDRLSDRKTLLTSLDQARRAADATGTMQGIDAFQSRAFEMLTSGKLLEALDVSREDAKVRERYGKGTDKEQGDAAPRLNEQFYWLADWSRPECAW